MHWTSTDDRFKLRTVKVQFPRSQRIESNCAYM